MNGVLKSMLKKMCQEKPKDWDRYLSAVLFAYREVPQASTGFSPFELLYGRTVRGPMQVLKEFWTEKETPEVSNTYQYVLELRNRLEETCKIARDSLYDAQSVYKHHYDKSTRQRRLKKGDKVLLLLPTEETYKDVQISESLTAEQQADVTRLLEELQCIFTDMPGTTHLAEHKIELTTKSPIRVRPYPIPYAKRQEVEKEVQTMLMADVIEPALSDYNSPIVLVKKKDGTNRFCVDYRRINLVTKFDTEPMGNPEDIMSKLKDEKCFSKIDLSKGFWQIMVEKCSQHLTAFSTTDGSYTFKKMPFGLVNSGSAFNRMMRKLLHGCSNADNYVDDILGHTRRWDDHLVTLRDIFTRVRDAGLTRKPSKCLIGFESIAFTGHVVGKCILQMEDDKLEKIRNAERPKTKKQVRAFLGLAGYYRRFILAFSDVAAPLTDLTKKGRPTHVDWQEENEHSFKTLKDMLIRSPILWLLDFDRPFILQADASDSGVGAALLQRYEDGLFPIAYASKKLLPREKNYSVIEREWLAIVLGIRKFQKYLYGAEFVLQTDHAPLSYIQKCKIESGRIMHYSCRTTNSKLKP